MKPWLTIVGVGLDGAISLNERAQAAISSASVVAGSVRLLDIMEITQDRRFAWPSPFSKGIAWLKTMAGQPVVVLATGDPMHFGVGATIALEFHRDEYAVLPAPSSLSLAAARMGWALQDVACLSLHGRPPERLQAALAPRARLLILTRDGNAPNEIMHLLYEAGYGSSLVSVLENLGGPEEARYDLTAADARPHTYAALNILAVQCHLDEAATYLPRLPGLPDSVFEHDGQLTKREIRTTTISALSPSPGDQLWDVGAGCGSVAIEWLRCVPGSKAIAFERNLQRLDMIRKNALRLGVPHIQVMAGDTPACLQGQPAPDAVFLGGSIADAKLFEVCWQALRSGGRFVANAVTLEGQAALAERHLAFGGELLHIAISHVKDVGRFRGLQPAMAVMQWRVVKS